MKYVLATWFGKKKAISKAETISGRVSNMQKALYLLLSNETSHSEKLHVKERNKGSVNLSERSETH